MQTYIWNPWSSFDDFERSMFATGSSGWPQLTSGGIAAKVQGLLGGDKDKKEAA